MPLPEKPLRHAPGQAACARAASLESHRWQCKQSVLHIKLLHLLREAMSSDIDCSECDEIMGMHPMAKEKSNRKHFGPNPVLDRSPRASNPLLRRSGNGQRNRPLTPAIAPTSMPTSLPTFDPTESSAP